MATLGTPQSNPSLILPFYPGGKATAVTPFPVAWLIENDLEGNYTGASHVCEKFLRATSYHRFVVSEAYSRHVRECKQTRNWVEPTRGNEFKKYPYPISVEHLEETVIYPIYSTQNYSRGILEELTLIPPNIVQVEFEKHKCFL